MAVKSEAGPIALGKTCLVMDVVDTAANTVIKEFSIESDSVLVSFFAESTSGTITVTVDTLTENGKTLTVITFPSITSASTELLLKKAAAVMSRIRVTAVYTDAATFEIRARGISAGELSVSILGASSGEAKQKDISSAANIIPSALTDRQGLIVRNNNTSGVLFIGYALAQATSAIGYPLNPGEAMGIDLQSGEELFGVASTGTIDTRIMEASS